MGFKQHISRTWQMIEQQVNDVPFRPHNEEPRLIKLKPQMPVKRRLRFLRSSGDLPLHPGEKVV